MAGSRKRLFDDLVPSSDMRRIVRNLKQGKVMWYAPDQDFGYRHSVFAPFFDFPTATLTTTARTNRILEQQIERVPEQYLWLHKRFKTRPRGEQGVY